MAAMAIGQPPTVEVGQTQGILEEKKITYANTLAAPKPKHHNLRIKPLTYLHGEPKLVWDEEEVQQMIINEDLQYAVIGKFSYGWPDILDLRKLIPKQCELKGEVNIGLLTNKYVLIRASLLEDYVKLLSKPQFYITHNHWSYPMRTLKWDPLFDPEEETTTAIAWISFPSLPPNFFENETIFSMAATVGRPLQNFLHKRNKQRRKNRNKRTKKTNENKVTKLMERVPRVKNRNNVIEFMRIKKGQQIREFSRNKRGGSNGTQLETNKAIADKEREMGEIKTLELEKEGDLVRKDANSFRTPKIDKKNPQEIQEKLDTKEEENMDANIHCISREGDLSPRHIRHLKERYVTHRNNNLDISYVNTKSRRNKPLLLDQ
ncbi:hypothetical protein MTR67_032437 [Solanum verrucosum]|uniref:DUF4283 domain-containing protein n=1 Tax=Solanum verrucosum TaxID=315347 RepID=A0AAF0U485_SOLVR|nr:hypothetical protein MTR67_032437 [Solanum verrucosum]